MIPIMRTHHLILSLILSVSAVSAHATDFYQALQLQMDDLQQIRAKTANDFTAGKCLERYRNLFKDGTLNITIGFGYSDAVPKKTVFDWYMVNGFRRVLTEPCRQGLNACEFKVSKNDPNKLFKMIEDPDGIRRRVEISVLRGSLTGIHQNNISPANIKAQTALCKATEARFYQEIKNGAEIVYYSGHSRDGGGPDFCPPLTRADGHVDYTWYRRNKPGLKLLTNALKQAVKPTQILALHSCGSTAHFYQTVAPIHPTMAILGYKETVMMTPDFQNQFGGLDALLSFRCQKGLSESMQKDIPTQIHRMF